MSLSLPVLGTVTVNVKYGNKMATLPLLVVKGRVTSLLGRNWLSVLKLDWHKGGFIMSRKEILDKHKAGSG